MIAGIVLVIGLLFLGMQMTDPSSNATLASEMSIAPDQALTDWAIFNRLIHFILDDIPLAGLLLFAAGVIYWISDWLNEKLGLALTSAPAPVEAAPAPPVGNASAVPAESKPKPD
jgi:hypothetical protein